MTEPVVVVGAGVAGLAAATALSRAGVACVVLESAARVGGRAHTVWPTALGGAQFELGAIWLHDAARNPLAEIARVAGEPLADSDRGRTRRTIIDGRFATDAEHAAKDAAWEAFEATADALIAEGADRPMADVARARADDPWAATIEAWEGSVIATADADALSLRDWRANQLDGQNLLVAGGLGAFVERRLVPADVAVRLSTPVRAIDFDGRDVMVRTDFGDVAASVVIVTVSTGVLASGGLHIRPMPDGLAACLDALPMGLAVKVALAASGEDRLGLPPSTSLDRRLARSGDPFMVVNVWPDSRPYASGWIGGRAGWALETAGPDAAGDYLRNELRAMLGVRAADTFGADHVVTGWGADPLFRGAYAYAVPGGAGARADLQVPFADGRLLIAGEATDTDGLAGTVAGAWNSGLRAAETIIRVRRTASWSP